MAKLVTINVLSKWKEIYNVRIQEKNNVLISVGIRECKLPFFNDNYNIDIQYI